VDVEIEPPVYCNPPAGWTTRLGPAAAADHWDAQSQTPDKAEHTRNQ
jgi:hypothetical protein